jgi:hypothetical protein
MMAATVAMTAMAGLFVLFGFFALGDTDRGCDGACGTCTKDCELDREGEPT